MGSKKIEPTERDIARFFKKLPLWRTIEDDECWPWQGACFDNGYGSFWIGGQSVVAHRVAWVIANNSAIPEGEVVRHSCDNRPCCRPSHLSTGTASDNAQDKARSRKYIQWDKHKTGIEYEPELRGEGKGRNILTREQVLEIRSKAKLSGVLKKDIAAEYGVSPQTVSGIVARHIWSFLGDDGEELYPPKPSRVGVRHHKAKLDEAQVLEMRREFAEDGKTYQDLGEKYGVHSKTIGYIIRRTTWRHI